MKNLTEFMASINEADAETQNQSNEKTVFVVKDNQGQILAVAQSESEAKAECKKWNSECKGNGATFSQEPAKDYMKK